MTRLDQPLRATAYSVMFLIVVLCMAQWVNCCRQTTPPIRPTTIPVILDDPRDGATADVKLERVEHDND